MLSKQSARVLVSFLLIAMAISMFALPGTWAAGVGNTSSAAFTYTKGTYSNYNYVTDLISDSNSQVTGIVKAYDDGTNLYVWIWTWAKPYLAYGEKLDGAVRGDGIPLAGGTINDMGSDGMTVGLDGVLTYTWKVGSGQTRNPQIQCPSWDMSNAAGTIVANEGVMAGPLVYTATIPMNSQTTFNIELQIHHSPPAPTLPTLPGTTTELSNTEIILGDSVTDTVRLSPDYNTITYQTAGDGAKSTATSFNVNYPSTLAAGDLLLLQIMVADMTNAPTVGNGFTLLYGPNNDGTGQQWIYCKFATGSESGHIPVTVSGSALKLARMYTFRNVASVSFNEDPSFGFASTKTKTITAQSVTTSGPNRLAVSLIFWNLDDDAKISSFTGETGGNWVEAVAEFHKPDGTKGGLDLQIAPIATAGTIAGGSDTLDKNVVWGLHAFALTPTVAGYPTGNVTFEVLPPSGSWASFDNTTLDGSGTATSKIYTPTVAGTYYFRALYHGDASHLPSQSGDTDEPLEVGQGQTQVTTLLSSSSIDIGGSVTDTATVTAGATGQVRFEVSTDGGFNFEQYGSIKDLSGGDPSTATSDSYTPQVPGVYYFRAVYIPDQNSNLPAAQSGDRDEPLFVGGFNKVPEVPLGTIAVLGVFLVGTALFIKRGSRLSVSRRI